jgi:hypothetical protein
MIQSGRAEFSLRLGLISQPTGQSFVEARVDVPIRQGGVFVVARVDFPIRPADVVWLSGV